MTKQIQDTLSSHVFTVEEVEDGQFQSVFPERLADESAIHPTEEDAWAHIEAVRKLG